MDDAQKNTPRPPVDVHVKADQATRFRAGTRWEVVASDLASLWDDAYRVALREIHGGTDDANS